MQNSNDISEHELAAVDALYREYRSRACSIDEMRASRERTVDIVMQAARKRQPSRGVAGFARVSEWFAPAYRRYATAGLAALSIMVGALALDLSTSSPSRSVVSPLSLRPALPLLAGPQNLMHFVDPDSLQSRGNSRFASLFTIGVASVDLATAARAGDLHTARRVTAILENHFGQVSLDELAHRASLLSGESEAAPMALWLEFARAAEWHLGATDDLVAFRLGQWVEAIYLTARVADDAAREHELVRLLGSAPALRAGLKTETALAKNVEALASIDARDGLQPSELSLALDLSARIKSGVN